MFTLTYARLLTEQERKKLLQIISHLEPLSFIFIEAAGREKLRHVNLLSSILMLNLEEEIT